MRILIGAWTVFCGLLLAVNVLGHEPADAVHLLRHAADWAILYALGLATVGGIALAQHHATRPLTVARVLGPADAHGDPVLRIGGMLLTRNRVHGPLGRSVSWSDVDSVKLERVNLVPFLTVLGEKRGSHRDGFRKPLMPWGTDTIVRLFTYYLEHPEERESIGTRDGVERAARLGLINITDHRE